MSESTRRFILVLCAGMLGGFLAGTLTGNWILALVGAAGACWAANSIITLDERRNNRK